MIENDNIPVTFKKQEASPEDTTQKVPLAPKSNKESLVIFSSCEFCLQNLDLEAFLLSHNNLKFRKL